MNLVNTRRESGWCHTTHAARHSYREFSPLHILPSLAATAPLPLPSLSCTPSLAHRPPLPLLCPPPRPSQLPLIRPPPRRRSLSLVPPSPTAEPDADASGCSCGRIRREERRRRSDLASSRSGGSRTRSPAAKACAGVAAEACAVAGRWLGASRRAAMGKQQQRQRGSNGSELLLLSARASCHMVR